MTCMRALFAARHIAGEWQASRDVEGLDIADVRKSVLQAIRHMLNVSTVVGAIELFGAASAEGKPTASTDGTSDDAGETIAPADAAKGAADEKGLRSDSDVDAVAECVDPALVSSLQVNACFPYACVCM